MTTKTLVFAAVLAGTAASVANAQLTPTAPTGSRVRVAPTQVVGERASFIRRDLARCILRRRPALADRFLRNSDQVSVDFGKVGFSATQLADRLDMPECLGRAADAGDTGLRTRPHSIRAMLLEESYLTAMPSPPAPLPADAPPVVRTFAASAERLPQARALAEVSDCVVARDAVKADALLRAPIGGKQEMAAARALAPALGPCLVEGQTIEFTPLTIRTMVADGLWHRYVAARPASTSNTR